MNTNKLLSYLLYALLIGLALVLGYKACQMKSDKARVAQEEAEFQKTLRDFGYIEDDSTGSAYSGEESGYTDPAPTTPTNTTPTDNNSTKGSNASKSSSDGIEYDSPQPVTAPPPTKTTTGSGSSSKNSGSSTNTTVGSYPDGRYRVVAGSFTVMDGARREMERLIKMGFHDAEVGRYNRGKYAVVIVKRTNSRNEAIQIANKLQAEGIDAKVIDRERKK